MDHLEQLLEQQLATLRANKVNKSAVAAAFSPATLTPTVPDSMASAIEAEVKRQMDEFKATFQPSAQAPASTDQPKLDGETLKKAAMELFAASLKPAEMTWLMEHVMKGAKGFPQFLLSDSIKTVVQMGFETYKDFLEGKAK